MAGNISFSGFVSKRKELFDCTNVGNVGSTLTAKQNGDVGEKIVAGQTGILSSNNPDYSLDLFKGNWESLSMDLIQRTMEARKADELTPNNRCVIVVDDMISTFQLPKPTASKDPPVAVATADEKAAGNAETETFQEKLNKFESISAKAKNNKIMKFFQRNKINRTEAGQKKGADHLTENGLSRWQSMPVINGVSSSTDESLLLAGMTAPVLNGYHQKVAALGKPAASRLHWTTRFSQRLNLIRQKLESRCASEHLGSDWPGSKQHVSQLSHQLEDPPIAVVGVPSAGEAGLVQPKLEPSANQAKGKELAERCLRLYQQKYSGCSRQGSERDENGNLDQVDEREEKEEIGETTVECGSPKQRTESGSIADELGGTIVANGNCLSEMHPDVIESEFATTCMLPVNKDVTQCFSCLRWIFACQICPHSLFNEGVDNLEKMQFCMELGCYCDIGRFFYRRQQEEMQGWRGDQATCWRHRVRRQASRWHSGGDGRHGRRSSRRPQGVVCGEQQQQLCAGERDAAGGDGVVARRGRVRDARRRLTDRRRRRRRRRMHRRRQGPGEGDAEKLGPGEYDAMWRCQDVFVSRLFILSFSLR